MRKALAFASLSFGLFTASLFVAAPAHAGISACGNIDVRADAQCSVEVSGGCTAKCTPVNFEAACSAQLQGGCEGQCNASASASCTTDCSGSCTGDCNVDPGSYDCSANCKADGDAQCQGQCSSNANQSECVASCKAEFSAKCDAHCTGTPPTATCEAKCNAQCSGSCEAQANIDCQISCQPPTAYASCEANLQGGCEAQCSKPEGALFCDGHYVDTGNNLANCVAAIEALFPTIHVSGYANANGSCTNGMCQAEANAGAKASCAVSPGRSDRGTGSALAVLLGASALLLGRRRQS